MKSISRQILVLLLALPGFATGQQTTVTDTAEYNKTHSKKVYFGSVVVHDGDTMAGFYLPSVMVRDKMVFKNARDERKWRKLIRDIKKVYPYAKIAGAKLRQCEAKLALPENQGRKKELMKQAEKEIKAEFEGDIRNMTWTQGIILLKLIDRETTHSSYEIVKELRGSLSAFFGSLWPAYSTLISKRSTTQAEPTVKLRISYRKLNAASSNILTSLFSFHFLIFNSPIINSLRRAPFRTL